MAWLFVRLKYRQTLNQFSSGRLSRISFGNGFAGYALLWILALAGGLALNVGLRSGFAHPGPVYTAAVEVAFTSALIVSLMAPLVLAGAGEPLMSPEQFDLLPLTDGQKVRGFLAAALVGPAPMLGVLVGFTAAGTAPLTPLTLLCSAVSAVLLLLMCACACKALGAVLAGVLSSRRGREIAGIVSALVFVGVYMVNSQISTLPQRLAADDGTPLLTSLGYLPPGSTVLIVADAAGGHWAAALGRIAYAVAVIAMLIALWATVYRLRLRGGGHQAGSGRGNSVASLYPAVLRPAPRTALWASAAQQLRYFCFRSNQGVQSLIGCLLGVGLATLSILRGGPGLMSSITAVATCLIVVITFVGGNSFGLDNGAFSVYVMTGADLKRVLAGKLVPAVLLGVPAAMAVAGLTVALGTEPALLGYAVIMAVVLVPMLAGLAAVTSVFAPFDAINRKGANPLRGAIAVVGSVVTAFVLVGILAGLTVGMSLLLPVPAPVAALPSIALDALIAWLLLRVAFRRVTRKPLTILALLGDKA